MRKNKKLKTISFISVLLCFFVVTSSIPVYAVGNTMPDAKGGTATV